MSRMLASALHLGAHFATPRPTYPAYTGNPNLITPGVLGFLAILFIALATVFLLFDMVRRIRRTRYREEIRAEIAAERDAADRGTPPTKSAG